MVNFNNNNENNDNGGKVPFGLMEKILYYQKLSGKDSDTAYGIFEDALKQLISELSEAYIVPGHELSEVNNITDNITELHKKVSSNFKEIKQCILVTFQRFMPGGPKKGEKLNEAASIAETNIMLIDDILDNNLPKLREKLGYIIDEYIKKDEPWVHIDEVLYEYRSRMKESKHNLNLFIQFIRGS